MNCESHSAFSIQHSAPHALAVLVLMAASISAMVTPDPGATTSSSQIPIVDGHLHFGKELEPDEDELEEEYEDEGEEADGH